MLEVGNGRLSLAENRTHFSMWAMLAAPLLAGNDLPNMKPEIHDILTNREVIAIDQDRLGHQATRVYSEGEVDVWARPLANGAMAIAVVNAGSSACTARRRAKTCGRAKRSRLPTTCRSRSPATTFCWYGSPKQAKRDRRRKKTSASSEPAQYPMVEPVRCIYSRSSLPTPRGQKTFYIGFTWPQAGSDGAHVSSP
jgi:hypothetical protein